MTQPIFLSSPANETNGWPPDPIANPQAWDKVEISGVISPGLARVGKFKRKWAWDEKKGKGAPRASLTFTGAYLARGTIEFWLMTGPDGHGGTYIDLQQWVTFSQMFQYDPTKKTANAVDIYHPSLAMIGLRSFICEELGNPTRVKDGDCLYTVEVSLIEWAPQQAVSVATTVTASKANPPQATNPPGKPADQFADALQQQIAAEIKIAQAPP